MTFSVSQAEDGGIVFSYASETGEIEVEKGRNSLKVKQCRG